MANSISRAEARKFVAGIIGGARSTQMLDAADEAILLAFEDWQSAKPWNFLLKDNSEDFFVTDAITTDTSPIVTAVSVGSLDGVNVGVSVSGSGIPADTTVLSYERDAVNGTIASITLSNDATATSPGTELRFGGYIPIIAGTQEYNAPTDFGTPFAERLLTSKYPLTFVKTRDWGRYVADPTVQGQVSGYNVYNPKSALTQNYGTKRLRVYRIPAASDILFLQYYRTFDDAADPLDIPKEYRYKFLVYAQWKLLEKKSAHDDRLPQLEKTAQIALRTAMVDDEEESEDDDNTMKSQMDMWDGVPGSRRLWSNGPFEP